MALIPSQVLRLAILLSYCSVLCHYKAIEMPAHQTYGGSWKFLTFIDLVIQAVFFGICVLTDLSSLLTKGSENQEQERQLKKLISLRDWIMAVLAFPVGVGDHRQVLPDFRTADHLRDSQKRQHQMRNSQRNLRHWKERLRSFHSPKSSDKSNHLLGASGRQYQL
uniref:Androgen-induced gene 1 protein isoform X3 n=1 Tax=Geotrypetes seraphini TaxID=260995 RepID=A0A6P8R653_GEOSA|nr:androgen-induced gene 1 protein isoform X3 [Geotrypetes seraphini]